MERLLLLAALALLLTAPFQAVARQPVSSTGRLGEASYRIDIPANWNGSLVLNYPGYEVPGEQRPDPLPLGSGARQFLMRGYAVAVSGYSRQGWAVEQALSETERLRRHFETEYGKPKRLYAVGGSMGGHIALAAIEQRPDLFDGAVTYCGANLPAAAFFREVLDAVAAFDAIFPGALPLGPEGLADPGASLVLDKAASAKLAAAVESDPERAGKLAEGIGVAVKDLPGTLWLYYAALQEMRVRAGGFPGDNRGTRYQGYGDDRTINRTIRRYAADPRAAAYVARHAGLTGRLRDPVIVLSNEYDDIVPVRLNAVYPDLVRRAGRQELFRQLSPAGRGHCNFRPHQIGAAFDALTGWVERKQRP